MKTLKRAFSEIEDKAKVDAWSDKNDLKPWQVSRGSEYRAYFKCPESSCGHEFISRVSNISNGKWCPYCSGNKLCENVLHCSTCLPKTFFGISDKDKVKAWSEKNDLEPWMVFKNAKKKRIFTCRECKHDFDISPDNINKNKGSWCSFCANKKLCLDPRECEICLPKTFYGSMSQEILQSWSDKNDFKPWNVFRSITKKAWFDCIRCGHSFETTLNGVSSGSWCPFCSGHKLCDNVLECNICLPKTFYGSADTYKVEAWSNKNDFSPWDVFRSASKKACFDCKDCGHTFESSLNHMTTRHTWCPYCSHNIICPDPRECESCLSKTFYGVADKGKVNSWSEKNKVKPWEVFSSIADKFWFDCEKCDREFEASLNKISHDGTWCPHCSSKRNKSVEKLCSILDTNSIKYFLEETIRLDNRSLHWDALCIFEGTEFFIESDGPHHFSAKGVTQVSKGKIKGDKAVKAFQDQRARDLLKETYINVNNGLLFRFSYRQTSDIEYLVVKMLEIVKSGKTGVVYMDDIYW